MRNQLSPNLVNLFRAIVMGYNHDRYWKYLMIVNNKSSKCPKLLKMLMFIYLKRTDAKWNCSFGANFNGGSKWITPPFATWSEWDNCGTRLYYWAKCCYISTSHYISIRGYRQ